jgi:hypothetical protein
MDTMWFFDRQARRRSTRFIIGESSHKVSPLNLTIYIFFLKKKTKKELDDFFFIGRNTNCAVHRPDRLQIRLAVGAAAAANRKKGTC